MRRTLTNPAAISQTSAATGGGMSGATRDADMAVSSVVRSQTATLVLAPVPH
jgi:hypothetical protein